MRYRRHIADRRDRETGCGQGTQGGFAPGTRPLDADFQRFHAMLLRLPTGILCGHLRGIGCRFPATAEPLTARGRPRNRIALHVGNRDFGVVEGRVDVGDAGRDVLAFAAANARCGFGH